MHVFNKAKYDDKLRRHRSAFKRAIAAGKSCNFYKPQSGFTLMELVVVIVVISLAFTLLITIAIPGGGQAEDIRKESLKLQQILIAAHEQAVFRAEEYGVLFDDNSYRFLRMDTDKKTGADIWVNVENDKLFRKRDLPEEMELDLTIEEIDVVLAPKDEESGLQTSEEKLRPQVFLLSSGEITPDFVAEIRTPGFDRSYEVKGTSDGRYELQETE